MKKWENAEVVELGLQNTKDNTCPEGTTFDNIEKSGGATFSATKLFCNKTKPDGTKAYEAGTWGICVYYNGCECTYVAPGGQS